MALYQKQLFGADGFVILTEGKVPGHLTRLDDKGAFPREYARLFVNAPDLIKALEEIEEHETDRPCMTAPEANERTIQEIRQIARAAIARATGAA
jgi:hypothetical protein